ncbi:MAG: hypothetical protein HY906_15930 [Deltaproteobacteria bacterium]|nr:hypothetical protein [Deltaproteobacteria bacterium]
MTPARSRALVGLVAVIGLWAALQGTIVLCTRGTARPSVTNVDWWVALSTLHVKRGFFEVWTPYPPVFPALHYAVVGAAARGRVDALHAYFFAGDRSRPAVRAAWITVPFVHDLWGLANLALMAAIALAVARLARAVGGGPGWLAGSAWALLQVAPFGLVRIGPWFDQFDYLPALLLLLGLGWLGAARPVRAGVATAIGVLTKAFPGVLIPMGLAALGRARALSFCAAGAITAAVLVAPFLLARPAVFTSTYRWSADRGGWESVWIAPERRMPPMPMPPAMGQLFGQPLPQAEVRAADGVANRQPGPRSRPPLRERLVSLAGLAAIVLAAVLLRRGFGTPAGLARGTLLCLTLLLFFSTGVSSYYFVWLLPLLFVVHRPVTAAALSAAFLLAANLELVGYPALPWYWWSLGARQLLFLGVIVAQVWALRVASTSPPASPEPAAPAGATGP